MRPLDNVHIQTGVLSPEWKTALCFCFSSFRGGGGSTRQHEQSKSFSPVSYTICYSLPQQNPLSLISIYALSRSPISNKGARSLASTRPQCHMLLSVEPQTLRHDIIYLQHIGPRGSIPPFFFAVVCVLCSLFSALQERH